MVSESGKKCQVLPPTILTSPFQTAVSQGFARRPAAGLGIGLGTTHFSRKDGGCKILILNQ
jgi:hypothetical protein